jgi:hypothetical protein
MPAVPAGADTGKPEGSTAMFLIRNLLDRLLLVLAVVGGGLVPGFIAQYRQRLGGRLDQALLDLAPWQKIAEQLYHGDLDRLIQYHLASADPTFHADGLALQALTSSVQMLQTAVDALHAPLHRQMVYLLFHWDPGLARATFADWVPTFALSGEGLIFAALFALVVWLLFQGLWSLVESLANLRLRRRPPRSPHTLRGGL